jgi:hypothetical protein
MRRWTTTAVTLAAIGCGGSEQEASPPAQTPAAGAQAPAPAPRRPSFPAADQFRIGESATLQGSGSVECDKLYLGDDVVALVEMWMHTGDGAVVRRCVGSDWADPASPTAAELAAVGAQLDGRLAEDFDGVGVDMDGALTFSPLGLADRASEITFAGRWAAYATASNVRDAAGTRASPAVPPGHLQPIGLGRAHARGADMGTGRPGRDVPRHRRTMQLRGGRGAPGVSGDPISRRRRPHSPWIGGVGPPV